MLVSTALPVPPDGLSRLPQPQQPTKELPKMERGLSFTTGNAFYRRESAVGRDLSVLAAIAYKREHGQLRALDALCGCGVRAMRYLVQASADFVWANDACDHLRPGILDNLRAVAPPSCSSCPTERWKVSTQDANKLLLGCYLADDYYDLIDVDSHGSNSVFFGSALAALKRGGLVYVTSTDGFSCSKRPYNALASYGTFTRRLPFINEIGLRMVIAGVVREAATRNLRMRPLFSHYSAHGPVFRIMLRMEHGELDLRTNYGFIAHCSECGAFQSVSWDELGQTSACSCSKKNTYTGPIWIGPLHNIAYLQTMSRVAKELNWIASPGFDMKKLDPETSKLTEVLDVMLEESNPALPCGYIGLHEIASRGKIPTPRRDTLTRGLQKEGYVVSRSQIEPNSLKTNASVAECIHVAQQLFALQHDKLSIQS
ncbi:hypothetical protein SELMODRAFT_132457 [Selaginella moellendorffii]|uniref:tRNA (guanine(26)-N(2))-dimethyltransferase n=3 Tax=Selaginella moellendorffii TaxID=88036 RepID=D8T5F8_SELML|nr:hypothetical protein SELMODRAFT_132457 [Selaginella moellendorffii]